MKNIPRLFLLLVLMIVQQPAVFSQADVALLRDLADENKKTVDALVLYPSETRLAILEATKHPEMLIKMQDMREKTSAAYRTLIEDFPRSTQAVFYDLSRYPGLTEQLIRQKDDTRALRELLEVLPEDKRDEAFGVITRQMPTLIKINDLDETTLGAFERMVKGYSDPAQQAFEHLLGLPEVIDLLNEDLRFTVLVGETYRDNPVLVIRKIDSLNLVVARAQAEELENWKKTIENDPAAKAELEAAAKEYATDNGYVTDDYRGDDLYYEGDYYGQDRDDRAVYHYYYHPYPYWYGYPWWEPYPRWHPYPWWWDWGYHFPPYGMVVVYMPSYHFMNWYFMHPHHHYRYNHLSTHFVNHYYGHRNSGSNISIGVREWHGRNRTIVSEDFLQDKGRLPERLKEYGRFEESREKYNASNPRKAVTAEEYLDKNARKYPDIQRSRETAKTEIQRETDLNREKRADWAPQKAPVKPEPAPVPKTQRPPRIETTPTPKPPDTRRPSPTQKPPINPGEAKDYHRQKWEEIKPPSTRSNPPSPAPRIKTTPPPPRTKTVSPSGNTPKSRGGRN